VSFLRLHQYVKTKLDVFLRLEEKMLFNLLIISAFSSSSHRILSATYGIAGCIGVDTTNATDLKRRGCAVDANGKTSAISTNQLRIFCQTIRTVQNADAMPVTFSRPMQASTVKAEHFEYLLNNGTIVKAICANAAPANENNEMQTFATIGFYGDGWKDTVYPVKVTIVGDSLFDDGTSAKGLTFEIPREQRFATGYPFLVQGSLQEFSTKGESNSYIVQRNVYPNHCQQLYGSNVTHRVRLVMNGGATWDGVNAMIPDTKGAFELLDESGNVISAPVLGLADLGSKKIGTVGSYVSDGDNFYDVCLNAEKGDVESIVAARMPCEKVPLVLPKGKPGCKTNTILLERD